MWILPKQETVSGGSGIRWAICKSAPRCRQITMPVPHCSVFLQAGCPSCRPTNSVKALKTHYYTIRPNMNRLFGPLFGTEVQYTGLLAWCQLWRNWIFSTAVAVMALHSSRLQHSHNVSHVATCSNLCLFLFVFLPPKQLLTIDCLLFVPNHHYTVADDLPNPHRFTVAFTSRVLIITDAKHAVTLNICQVFPASDTVHREIFYIRTTDSQLHWFGTTVDTGMLPLLSCCAHTQHEVCTRAFQFGQKKFRFDSRYRIDIFDSIRQSDKFAACTLIFK